MNRMKIAILTTFEKLPPQYPLTSVVLNQLRTLVKYGYTPALFTFESFPNLEDVNKLPDGIDLKPCLPFMHLYDYQVGTKEQKHSIGPIGEHGTPSTTNFKKQVALIIEYLEDELCKYDIVITHDIMMQGWFLIHNAAIREIAGRHPHIKWIHWMHSEPLVRPTKIDYPQSLRFTPMVNSVYVTMNEQMRSTFAIMLDAPKNYVKCVYHAADAEEYYSLHPATIELLKKHDLFSPDVVCVWPVRFDQPGAKQLEKAIYFVGQMNKIGSAKLVFANSWSKDREELIANLRKTAQKWGLSQENLVFTSELGKKYVNGVPRQVVHNLFEIGNLFILPSKCETFSLVMLEAALSKNYIVLNEDLAISRELMGDNVDYIGFGSHCNMKIVNRKYEPDEKQFLLEQAQRVYSEMKLCKPLMAHKRALRHFSEQYIWETQFKPLIEEK